MVNSKQIKSLAVLALLFSPLFAGEDWKPNVIGPFGTLNNRDNSIAIPSTMAQDLLNVNITPGGKSVKKRSGYGTAFTLSVASSPVHGIYSFFDANGNEVSLFFNDSRMAGSVAGASPTVIFSTGPNGATYQCTDSLGSAYCANTQRTTLVKTNGLTYSLINNVISTGTMVASCPTRLAMAGFSDAPSRIDFSAATDFTTWGSGSLGTSPCQFTINAPGAKITHITYAFGRLMWFKDTSFGYILLGNQALQSDWVIQTVSFDVGTNDNTSVYREGILYFRGKDSHIYAFDGTNYQRLSKEIAGTVNLSQTRTGNSWTQTTQADWQAGNIPSDLSATIVSGDLTSKTTSFILTSAADWGAGSFSGSTQFADTITTSGSLVATFPETFSSLRDGTSGTKNVWIKNEGSGSAITVSGGFLKLQNSQNGAAGAKLVSVAPVATSSLTTGGTTFYYRVQDVDPCSGGSTGFGFSLGIATITCSYYHDLNSAGTVSNVNNGIPNDAACPNLLTSITNIGVPFDVFLWMNQTSYRLKVVGATTSGEKLGSHTFSFASATFSFVNPLITSGGCTSGGADTYYARFDTFGVSPETFTFTSSAFDTGISSPVFSTFTITSAGDGTLSHTSQVSNDNVTFDTGVTLTSATVLASVAKRYAKINSTFTQGLASGPALGISDYSFTAGSSGTFQSAVKNASGLTSWDTFQVTDVKNGGTLNYYMRASTNPISVLGSTPSWTSVTSGGIPSVSTGTYFQVRADFYGSNGSQNVTLKDFTQSWFEGVAADKSYATYFDDKILWSVASGTGATTNNRQLVFDLLNQGWTIYDLPSNGFLVKNNTLFFGSSSTGTICQFGTADNDNGSAINAYWKSKDFFGDNPFTTQELANISIAAKSVANSSMTVTYTIDGSSSTAFTMALGNGTANYIDKNKNLPAGTVGSLFNVKFGNNAADQPFEVFGIQVGSRERSWIPTQ